MLVPVRSATAPPEVKIGKKVTEVLAYSVFDSSTSVLFGTSWSVLEAIAADRIDHRRGRWAVIDLPAARCICDSRRAWHPDTLWVRNRLGIAGLNNVLRHAHGDALQINRGGHDQTALHIAVQVIDDTDLLHLRAEIVVHRVEALLQRNAASDGGRENDGAEAETDQHFTKGEAGD